MIRATGTDLIGSNRTTSRDGLIPSNIDLGTVGCETFKTAYQEERASIYLGHYRPIKGKAALNVEIKVWTDKLLTAQNELVTMSIGRPAFEPNEYSGIR